VQQKLPASKREIIKQVLILQEQGKLRLEKKTTSTFHSLRDYLFSVKATWYWITITIGLATPLVTLMATENILILYARYILGSIFVLYLPGYSLIKMLFPQKELENIEKGILSIVMSLTITPLNALILNYTPWGITLASVTSTLLVITFILTTIGIIREYEAQSMQWREI